MSVHMSEVPVMRHDLSVRIPLSHSWESMAETAVNQGQCGSCWAIVAAQCTRDRRALAGVSAEPLSYQHIADCAETCVVDYNGRRGCAEDCLGGFLSTAFAFLMEGGVVPARLYGAKYAGSPGVDHVGSGIRTSCTLPDTVDRAHMVTIKGFYIVSLFPEMYGVTNAYDPMPRLTAAELKANADNIAHDVYFNGPCGAAMNMFSDFSEFVETQTGEADVYEVGWQLAGGALLPDPVGSAKWSSAHPGPGGLTFVMGHALSILGYGVTSAEKIPYWIVRNSWGEFNGTFKIRRGNNTAGIESDVEACVIGSRLMTQVGRKPTVHRIVPTEEVAGWIVLGLLLTTAAATATLKYYQQQIR